MKVCIACKEEKELSEFSKDKSKKDGFHIKCKSCVQKYYQENKEKRLEKQKKYYIENKELIKKRVKKYRQENKEIIKETKRKHYKKNKERINNSNKKILRQNNKNKKYKYFQERI